MDERETEKEYRSGALDRPQRSGDGGMAEMGNVGYLRREWRQYDGKERNKWKESKGSEGAFLISSRQG
jgi:hypothetical protein